MAKAISEAGVVLPDVVPEESSRSGTSWGSVIAGAVAAAAATLVLMLVGAGLGLTMVSPFSNEGISVETATVSTAIWLIVVQWLSALLGGYMAGRLRTKRVTCTQTKSSSATPRTASSPGRWRHCSSPDC
jgi:hypothetical protein